MAVNIPQSVLQNARIARVLTCLNCRMDVAHDSVGGMLALACCETIGPICQVCATLVGAPLWSAVVDAHKIKCRSRIAIATTMPEPAA